MNKYPEELNKVKDRGANMAGFVPLLYSIMTDYKNGQKGPRTVLEIGVRWGTSTLAFLHGIKDRGKKHKYLKLYSMDIGDCSKVVKDDELKKYWEFMQGDSKTLPWDKEIDVLLIDGDHSYEGVKADYERFEPFVKEGGIILMHDVLWAHKGVVRLFWDEVDYPKTALPLSKSGLGIIYKKHKPFYNDDLIRYGDEAIKQGR